MGSSNSDETLRNDKPILEGGPIRKPGALALTIVGHPEMRRLGERAMLKGASRTQPGRISRLDPVFRHPGAVPTRTLEDGYVSRQPVLVIPVEGGVQLRASSPSLIVSVDDEPLGKDVTI